MGKPLGKCYFESTVPMRAGSAAVIRTCSYRSSGTCPVIIHPSTCYPCPYYISKHEVDTLVRAIVDERASEKSSSECQMSSKLKLL